jgi:hypothetical protein
MKLISVQTNAKSYSDNIRRYADETGKSMADAIAREGPDFRQELYRQFRAIHPNPGDIFKAAASRGFKVSRNQSSFLVKTENGLSSRALNRAREILGGQKSDYFRWVGSRLVPVRFSARGQNKILQGGRSGRRFASSALRAYQLTPSQFASVGKTDRFKAYDVRRLNLRALAVYLELRYRQRASQGGTMAVQWLFKTWKRGNSQQRAQLVQRSATNIPIGTVDFDADILGNLQTIIFNGFVPGTGAESEKHGVVSKVFAARASALSKAIQLHHDKIARQARLQ